MKRNVLVAIILGLIVVSSVILVFQSILNPAPAGDSSGPDPTPAAASDDGSSVKADVLEKFDMLKEMISAGGYSFGGASIQQVGGDEVAMVYIYRPVASGDTASLLLAGYTALYPVFDVKDPLLVGLVDTTEKINPSQYKVDIYALERSSIKSYMDGGATASEIADKAIVVTPETQSLRASDSPVNKTRMSIDLEAAFKENDNGFVEPPDRSTYVTEYMNESGFDSVKVAPGNLENGEKIVSLTVTTPGGMTNEQKYDVLDASLKALCGGYGDYDRFMISLIPTAGTDYYVVDAGANPVLNYMDGDISQRQLYNAINLTYYTK
ncbi:hypothetical protein CUJ83_05495 [Methanocella sp. CWC-04]|uniref:Uncharacterized protein n=1 Tax=Methanooceanicella nereidis TaxID=2052831 RepID=A0AAP2RBK4_9EURY|nr:hypothetical protein [Methanocella sp. CWC-04]MCD1294453.1 hypothetical protein [Methanocella sp. CWC-04]